jgi:hypothetical protein
MYIVSINKTSYLEVVRRRGILVVVVTLVAHGLVGLVLLVVRDIHQGRRRRQAWPSRSCSGSSRWPFVSRRRPRGPAVTGAADSFDWPTVARFFLDVLHFPRKTVLSQVALFLHRKKNVSFLLLLLLRCLKKRVSLPGKEDKIRMTLQACLEGKNKHRFNIRFLVSRKIASIFMYEWF